jgi:hypothetical protein
MELANGMTVRYHRVTSVTSIVNNQNLVEVASYIDASRRDGEREAMAAGEDMDVLVSTKVYAAPYDGAMSVSEAYAWLKGLPAFDGSEDA